MTIKNFDADKTYPYKSDIITVLNENKREGEKYKW
jgi:hypothetical protein